MSALLGRWGIAKAVKKVRTGGGTCGYRECMRIALTVQRSVYGKRWLSSNYY